MENDNNIENLEELYTNFVYYLFFYTDCTMLEYYQLIYGEQVKIKLGTGSETDVEQLLAYRIEQGKLPDKLQTIFNEWLLTKM